MLALISDDEGRREEGKRPRKEKGKVKVCVSGSTLVVNNTY
jgi:hypothetical protein